MDKFTSIQTTKETRTLLKEIALKENRSMCKQLTVIIARAHEQLHKGE